MPEDGSGTEVISGLKLTLPTEPGKGRPYSRGCPEPWTCLILPCYNGLQHARHRPEGPRHELRQAGCSRKTSGASQRYWFGQGAGGAPHRADQLPDRSFPHPPQGSPQPTWPPEDG